MLKNPQIVLAMARLDGNPPKTRQELEEAIDQVLFCWSDNLADDETARFALAARVTGIVYPQLEVSQ